MLNRVYIDNYKCFVNFECWLDQTQLILGDNGSGKTTFFDVLETLRGFITAGLPSVDAFPTSTLTAWDKRLTQTFELEISGNDGKYHYRLVIEHERKTSRNRVKSEELRFDEQPLYQYEGGDAHLYRDNYSPGPVFPFDWSRLAIATIPERNDSQKLTWFRERMEKLYIFSPDPVRMLAIAESELSQPDRRLHHLASWLRHLSQESVDTISTIRDALRENAIDGLVGFKLEKAGESSRILKLDFEFGDESDNARQQRFSLSFDQLSDGQRNLVALFTILMAAVEPDATVCLDEPDNYVALREIQPWLVQLRDRIEKQHGQCIMVSHHPEVINYLAAKHGVRFFRDDAGPTRAERFESNQEELIAPAELIARGWK